MKVIVGSLGTNWIYQNLCAFDHRMAYVEGLERLGHEVFFMANISEEDCINSDQTRTSFPAWEGRKRFESHTRSYDIWPRSCLIYEEGEATCGMDYKKALAVARSADLLININGRLNAEEIFDSVCCRAYLDLDPGQTQVYFQDYGIDRGFAEHEFVFTVGANIGADNCPIPTCGSQWYPYWTPVVTDRWSVQRPNTSRARFSTISNWGAKASFDFQGKWSGDKAENWRRFIDVPRLTGQPIEIALNIHPAYESDISALKENGWVLSDPQEIDGRPTYRRFVAQSKGEFSVADNAYVEFNIGWLSDRSVRYLAAGRPVIIQSTGIEDHLPIGNGLLTFRDIEGAVDAIDRVGHNYEAHCQSARQLAEEYFDSDSVLRKMLDVMGFSGAG
jgi:hypothetical protein